MSIYLGKKVDVLMDQRRAVMYLLVASTLLVAAAVLIMRDQSDQNHRYRLQGNESPLLRFVVEHLMDPSGGIYTNLRDDLALMPDMAGNHQMLSESTGLMMEYALRTNRQALFDTQVDFLRKRLMTREGGIRWVYEKDGPYGDVHVNAAIDDLKIIAALLDASERWEDGGYGRLADRLARVLFERGTAGDLLPDYYDWRYGEQADEITSSYLDLGALGKLADRYPEWRPILDRARSLLESARGPGGLFLKTYRISEGRWIDQDSFNMIDVLYVAHHLAADGADISDTADMIERKWREDGRLSASYDSAWRTVDGGISPAVYALAYRLLAGEGRADTAEEILAALYELSVRDERSPWYGGFVDPSTLEAYSFDHLQALLAESALESER